MYFRVLTDNEKNNMAWWLKSAGALLLFFCAVTRTCNIVYNLLLN